MTEKKVEKFQLRYIFQLINLAGHLWSLDKEIKSKVLYFASSAAYIFYMLSKSNYNIMIKDNKKLISFLASRDESRYLLFKYIYLSVSFIFIFIMILYKDGRSIFTYQLGYNKLSDNLVRQSNKKYHAELVLFVTDPVYQGSGYGKKLLDYFYNFLTKKGKNFIYLITDNYCDYKLYDKAGCTRTGSAAKTFNFLAGIPFNQELYLYEYKIN